MATYTRGNVAIQSGLRWDNATQLSVLGGSSTFVRLLNKDGTVTEVTGTGFPTSASPLFSGTATGTVSALRRLSSDGTMVFESITGLNHSLAGLIAV
jgi:hypothetical protein